MKHFIKLVIIFGSFLVLANNNSLANSSTGKSIVFGNQSVLRRYRRIVNGEIVKGPNLYPFMVHLIMSLDNGIGKLCGGSLIAKNWVLTAAHCIDKIPSHVVLWVTLGDPKNEHTRQIIKADNFFIHENWSNLTYQNDIALIKLPTSAVVNEHVGTIQIASDTIPFDGQYGTILGYGKIETAKQSDVLRQVNVKIISNEACRATNSIYNKTIKSSHICTDGSNGRGFCNGDSGGPLIINNTLIGVSSISMPDCTSGLPSVFTRVLSYSQWINKIVWAVNVNANAKTNVIVSGNVTVSGKCQYQCQYQCQCQ